jgi:hypothetical protein
MDNFKLVLECGFLENDEVKQLKKEFKQKYNIDFKHKPRKYDQYSNWIFTGSRENIKKFILEDYLPNCEIDINDLDEEYDDEILDLIRN